MAAALNSVLLLLSSISILALYFYATPIHALNLGLRADVNIRWGKECSRTCESKFCALAFAPFLRYGKYCGLKYSGCPGERPCDGLDACCMHHDACIKSKNDDYLNKECNLGLRNCVIAFDHSGSRGFPGSTCSVHEVVHTITEVMNAAVFAGTIFNTTNTDQKKIFNTTN